MWQREALVKNLGYAVMLSKGAKPFAEDRDVCVWFVHLKESSLCDVCLCVTIDLTHMC